MDSPRFNRKSPTIKRILREAQELTLNPSPDYHASPASDSDLFDWHFTLRGPSSSPFSSGIYHGRIILPPTYPLRPPMFRFLTPSGRFELNRDICLSISGHHEESWQPAWGIRTAIVALRGFMETSAMGQLGGLECSAGEREKLAKTSGQWRCSMCQKTNEEILAETAEEARKKAEEEGEAKNQEVEVPKELKMAFKDELGKEKQGEDTSAELAEGFVQTTDGTSESPSSSYPAARPAQTVPQPTGSPSTPTTNARVNTNPPQVTAAARLPTAAQMQQMQRPESRHRIPIWVVDRAIAAVVFCLVGMVMKVVLGL